MRRHVLAASFTTAFVAVMVGFGYAPMVVVLGMLAASAIALMYKAMLSVADGILAERANAKRRTEEERS